MISILNPGKDPALPSSYWPISLLDTIGKLFEKILLVRIIQVVRNAGCCETSSLRSDPKIPRHCSWPASLNE